MFVFFSVSAGKRAVYLLPLYPPLSLLLATWFHEQGTGSGARSLVYRSVAIVAIVLALLFFIITLGAMWNDDSCWFLAPIQSLLKTKDRVNLALVRNELEGFNWMLTIILLLSPLLWFCLARCLWVSRMRAVACQLLMISILLDFVAAALVMPAIARTKTYRPFMEEVNQRMKPGDKLYLYDDSFNSDSVVFYRGGPIDMLEQPAQLISKKLGSGDEYVIMSQKAWRAISASNPDLPPPLLQSEGSGPEGDALLVLIRRRSSSSD
jgi:hypothetical protein